MFVGSPGFLYNKVTVNLKNSHSPGLTFLLMLL